MPPICDMLFSLEAVRLRDVTLPCGGRKSGLGLLGLRQSRRRSLYVPCHTLLTPIARRYKSDDIRKQRIEPGMGWQVELAENVS